MSTNTTPAASGTNVPEGPLTATSAAALLEGFLSAPAEDPDLREPSGQDQTDTPADDTAGADHPPEDGGDDAPPDDQTAGAEGEPELPATVTVPGEDGAEVEVTLDELRKGYLRHADYTRKTQALAEQKRAHETERDSELGSMRDVRAKYAAALEKLDAALAASQPAEPDWDKLRQEAPDEFAVTYAAWKQQEERREKVRAERQRVAAEQDRERLAAYEKFVRAESDRLLEALPEWKDPAKRQAERSALVAFARKMGFTDDELKQFVDHRSILVLRLAMLGARGAAPRGPAPARTIRSAPPGSGVRPKTPEPGRRALERLAKTGSVNDAADALFHALGSAAPPRPVRKG